MKRQKKKAGDILVSRFLDGVQLRFTGENQETTIAMGFEVAKCLAENIMRAYQDRPKDEQPK